MSLFGAVCFIEFCLGDRTGVLDGFSCLVDFGSSVERTRGLEWRFTWLCDRVTGGVILVGLFSLNLSCTVTLWVYPC